MIMYLSVIFLAAAILLGIVFFILRSGRISQLSRKRLERGKSLASSGEDNSRQAETPTLLRSCFKGLSYILANENDKAVAEFIKVAKIDSATAEIYLAIGQLFRNSGEMERAIRVHRDILLRPNLPDAVRLQTFHEIGLDYKKAGLLDRASRTFEEILVHDPEQPAARRELSTIYEKTGEWEKALVLHRKNSQALETGQKHVIAHLETEVGKQALSNKDYDRAARYFKQALNTDPGCVDAWLHQGDLWLERQKPAQAVNDWQKAFSLEPNLVYLTVARLAKMPEPDCRTELEDFFARNQAEHGDNPYFMLAYADWLLENGELEKSADLLSRIMASRTGNSEIFTLVRKFLDLLTLPTISPEERQRLQDKTVKAFFTTQMRFEKPYRCRKCGYRLDEIAWKCPRCYSWDTIGVI